MKGRTRPRSGQRRGPRPQVTLRIESIAAGGEGVGRLEDGRVVFVHRTAPGETIEAELTRQTPRWARGRLLRLLDSAPERRPPLCPHYADCGGCTLEHLTYPAQLEAKSRIVRDALARIGGIQIDPPSVTPSPRETRYRNRVSFSLRRLGSGHVVAGFHSLHDPDRIVPIDGECLLPEEPIGLVWDRLRSSWCPDANLLPSGEQIRLTLRATRAGRVSLLVEGGFSHGRLSDLLERVDGLDAIWHRRDAGVAELAAGAPGLPETWGEESFDLSGGAFVQVNREAAALLEAHVLDLAGDVEGRTVVDAYCGIGLHARRLERGGALVLGIELDPDAVAAAISAAPAATFVEGRVEEHLSGALPADLLILNPPRAGVDPRAIEAILAAPPERVIYVSCDPATLARDLARLSPTLALRSVRCFDLFPQTAHVETVVLLERS